ncbi:hypothetical protein RYX36_031940, partial [Vicia faba]
DTKFLGVIIHTDFGNPFQNNCDTLYVVLKANDYTTKSIKLLRHQGIDLKKNKKFEIDAFQFAEMMMSSGIVCNEN